VCREASCIGLRDTERRAEVPVRIYALAKDLKIDSKELVDLCTKAGIQGKGSALASLEDDEVAKLKAFMDNAQAKRAGAAAVAPTRETERARIGTPIRPGADHAAPIGTLKRPQAIPTLRSRGAAGETTGGTATVTAEPEVVAPEEAAPAVPVVAQPAPEAPVEPAAPETPTIAAHAPASESAPSAPETPVEAQQTPPPAAPVAPPSPPREERPAGPLRGDFMAGRGRGPIRVMDRSGRGGAGEGKRDGGGAGPARPRGDREPSIRLAAMPEVRQPQPKAPTSAAQKPIISLRPDALKSGTSIESQLRNLEKPKVEPGKKGPKTGAPGKVGAPGEVPSGPAPLRGRGGKGKGRDEEEAGKKAGGGMDAIRAQRQANRGRVDDDDRRRRGPRRTITRIKGHTTTAPRKGKVQVELPCTVRSFSEQAGVSTGQVMNVLFKTMGLMVNINAPIPDEYVELLTVELGLDLEIKQSESLEEKLLNRFAAEDDPESLQARPPIVTFLGHVDHGKTSLLDRIIGINVVSGEAGGITQHIRAYQIATKDGRKVAFVDTPGHEAFTEMRARGANVTDIAVLVVAADDGIMRQTEEAISHAKAAGVPIVVAMNKIDLPGANPQRVLEQLAANELLPSEWGGQVEVVRTSAITGQGMDELLETLLLTADINDYQANPDGPAQGTCLEAEQEPGRGVIAKVMVRNGTLREGDIVVCGAAHGRVKAMYDTLDGRKKLKEAGPSTPVNLTGLDVAPNAGDPLYVLDDIAEARELAAQRAVESRERSLSGVTKRVSLEEFQRRLAEGRVGQEEDVVTLNLIIRADVRGSIEAITKELSKFDHPEVQIRVLQAAVGGVSVGDVTLASASDAVIIGFNVIPDEDARQLAEERQVEIRRYDIIYKLTDDIKALLEGKLKPEERSVDLGRVVVKQVFNISRVGVVAGCYVIQGTVERNSRVRVFRDGRIVGDYAIDTLRRERDDVKEVPRGMECGIKLVNFNDVKQDDVLEVYKIEEVARTL
jgi:translation initiation factor IF-2